MILSLCDYTGNMVRPWIENGYDCMIVDVQHEAGKHKSGRLTKVGEDIMTFEPPENIEMVFAFPPCTHLAGSGARWWAGKGLPALIEALTLVNRCLEICEISGAPWMIENPVGRLSTCWRKPNYYFDPCDYGDPYTKRTCLWTSMDFVMPMKKRVVPVEGSKMHLIPPGPDRANLRSETPMGFARAVYDANRKDLR